MDEDQENVRATKNEEEEEGRTTRRTRGSWSRRHRRRKQNRKSSGAERCLMWGLVALTPKLQWPQRKKGEEERAAKCESEGKEKTAKG